MIDVLPSVLVPTWNNGRHGAGGLAKRLDMFFMTEVLSDYFGRYRIWAHSTGFFDHKENCLQLDFDSGRSFYPFKFNPIWLEDSNFCLLVKNFSCNMGSSCINRLMFKLQSLKGEVILWERL